MNVRLAGKETELAGTSRRAIRAQDCHGVSGSRDHDSLARFDGFEQARELRFCLVDIDGAHGLTLASSITIVKREPKNVTPTIRGAIVSESELSLLRRIENVVRLGHVRKIEPNEIVLDEGRPVPRTPS